MKSKHTLKLNSIYLFAIFLLTMSQYSVSQNTKKDWHTYKNDDLGFSLQLPEAPNYSDDYETFIIYSYNDSDSKKIYSFFGLDLRNSKATKPEELIESFISNIVSNLNGELLNNDEIKYKNGLKHETTVKINSEKLVRSQFVLQNQILYYLSVEDKADRINDVTIDRFFNSLLISSPKQNKVKDWIDYTNDNGAFSLRLPSEPKEIPREVNNPLDEDGEPYILNMYSVTDLKNENNYLFRYNDQPLGYFLEDPIGGFQSLQDDFEGKADLVSPPKTISLNGYEGREFELLIQSKYHCICRVYFRGNRTYLLLKHKLNETDKISTEDDFFKSFTFNPYTETELTPLQPKDTNFEVLFYEDYKLTVDSTDYDNIYVKNSNDYFATNTSSGGVYQFGYSDLQDYFKIKTKKELYEETMNSLANWNDTILKQKEIKVNNKEALEFYIQNKTSNIITRHQIWLDYKRLFLMTGYLANEERNNEITNSFFNSYKVIKEDTPFDVFASKTQLIFEDLQSKDTLVYNKAFGALDYYQFEVADLPKIYKAINTTYKDSTTTELIKNKLVEEFSLVNDSTTVSYIRDFYTQENASDAFKTALLSVLPDLSNTNALETYKQLLIANPPTDPESYSWTTLAPFRDSLDYAIANHKDLLNLIKHQSYRANIVSIFTEIIQNNSEQIDLVDANTDALLKYALSDLKLYNEANKDEESYDYEYNSLIYSYLDFFNKLALKNEVADAFTKPLANQDDNDWFQLHAITARLNNNLDLDEKLLAKKLDTLYSRFEIMETYHRINQFEKIPKKYLKPNEFAKLALYNYLGEDDSLPNEIDVLGKIKQDNIEYYVISYAFTSDDESDSEKYIGIVGPVENVSQDLPFKRPVSYSNWDVLEKNWKNQAKALIPDLIEYGY